MGFSVKKWLPSKRSFGVILAMLLMIVATFWTDSYFKINPQPQAHIKNIRNCTTNTVINNDGNNNNNGNAYRNKTDDNCCKKNYSIEYDLNNTSNNNNNKNNNRSNNTKKKLILLWTECYKRLSIEGWFGSNEESFLDCPYKCEFTMNKSLYNLSDALFVEGLPVTRQPPPSVHNIEKQIWALFRIESPARMDWRLFGNKFNWTMSYRRDSDILWPAGRFVPIRTGHKPKIPSMDSIRNKTHLIAWTVSNCNGPSGRWRYVDILKKYVQVDIYGKCGNHTCPIPRNCYEELAPQYKFWLAFENSICLDYVTEKMYQAMRAGIVPIVYGHPGFKKVAIPGSYINVYDFESAKDLVSHLHYLDKNPMEYLKYFEWNKKFELLTERESWRVSWCDVCTRLNTMDFEKDRKWYASIGGWYDQNNTSQSLCKTPYFESEGTFSL